jgi:hypothetical protein
MTGTINENKMKESNTVGPNLNFRANQQFTNTSSIPAQDIHFPLKRASKNLNPYSVPNDTAPQQSINIKLTHIGE